MTPLCACGSPSGGSEVIGALAGKQVVAALLASGPFHFTSTPRPSSRLHVPDSMEALLDAIWQVGPMSIALRQPALIELAARQEHCQPGASTLLFTSMQTASPAVHIQMVAISLPMA